MNIRLAALLAVTAAMAGCYTYVPVNADAVSPGETVRARLTLRAREQVGARAAQDGELEGKLLERQDRSLTLFVPAARRQRGFFSEELHERVHLDRSDVIELERRQLDRPKTYVLSGVAAAVVLGIAIETLTGKTGGNTIDRTDPGPSAAVIPLFTFGIR